MNGPAALCHGSETGVFMLLYRDPRYLLRRQTRRRRGGSESQKNYVVLTIGKLSPKPKIIRTIRTETYPPQIIARWKVFDKVGTQSGLDPHCWAQPLKARSVQHARGPGTGGVPQRPDGAGVVVDQQPGHRPVAGQRREVGRAAPAIPGIEVRPRHGAAYRVCLARTPCMHFGSFHFFDFSDLREKSKKI